MDVIDAIYQRRATRNYSDIPITKGEIHTLLQAAVRAPSAMNEQPWAFAVIQSIESLKMHSDQAKAHLLKFSGEPETQYGLHKGPADPDFNIFYDAGTLIIVCAKPGNDFASGDCCLAGENLMLAAFAFGLGTCPIGFALPYLRLPETKLMLGIPTAYVPILPIIVGHPVGITEPTARKIPEITSWL